MFQFQEPLPVFVSLTLSEHPPSCSRYVNKISDIEFLNSTFSCPSDQTQFKIYSHYIQNICLDLNDVSFPSHRWSNGWQPLKNIVTNGWLTKPLKNRWSQWLSRYHSINGNGHLKNHWLFAMVLNFLPLCLAEADIKQTNDSFWKIKNIFLQCLEQDVPWFRDG